MSYPPGPYEGSPEWQGQKPEWQGQQPDWQGQQPDWQGQQPAGWQGQQPDWQGQQPAGWQGQQPGWQGQQPGWQGQQPGWPALQAPDTYLVWAILTTVFCCLPLGIVSIVYSTKVSGLWAQGRYPEAQAASESAKKWAIIAAIVGGVFWLIAVILWFALAMLGLAVSNMPSTTTTTFSGF